MTKKQITLQHALDHFTIQFGARPEKEGDGYAFHVPISVLDKKEVIRSLIGFFNENEMTDGKCSILHTSDMNESVFILANK